MSADLIAWLMAQLDADEQHARKDLLIAKSAGDWEVRHGVDMPSLIERDGALIGQLGTDEAFWHLSRFKPQRMREMAQRALDEIVAKRGILRLHTDSYPDQTGNSKCLTCNEHEPCETVRLLAQPHRGREGFCGEWTMQ